jgi:hypothetical protein
MLVNQYPAYEEAMVLFPTLREFVVYTRMATLGTIYVPPSHVCGYAAFMQHSCHIHATFDIHINLQSPITWCSARKSFSDGF